MSAISLSDVLRTELTAGEEHEVTVRGLQEVRSEGIPLSAVPDAVAAFRGDIGVAIGEDADVSVTPHTEAWVREVAALTRSLASWGVPWWVSPDLVQVTSLAATAMPAHPLDFDAVPTAGAGLVLFGVPIGALSGFAWGASEEWGVLGILPLKYRHDADPCWDVWGAINWAPGEMSDSDDVSIRYRHIAACLWNLASTSRLAEAVERPTWRPGARRTARSGSPVPRVVTVDLRQPQRHRSSQDSETVLRHYDHRWLVSGHWRQQPYGAGRIDRRLTYVHPYIKGPEDRPLVVKDVVGVLR